MSLVQRKSVQGNGDGGPEVRGVLDEQMAEAGTETTPAGVPDPELIERARRRRFTSEYKLAILAEADGLTHAGEVGALLRREGLYSSHLSTWRRLRDQGALEALSRPRGCTKAEPLEAENAELRRRLSHTEAELEKARRVIEVQGNVCALLGELHGPRGAKPTEPTE
jgi:transposase